MDTDTYENDMSLYYKYATDIGYPLRLVKYRKKTEEEEKEEGAGTYIYYSVFDKIIEMVENKEELEYIVDTLEDENINTKDIVMLYYNININDENILNTINNFYMLLNDTTIERYDSIETINAEYSKWYEKLTEEATVDAEKYKIIITAQETLKEVSDGKNYGIGPLTLNTSVMGFTPRYDNGDTPSIEDGIDIFNISKTSKHIPYIKYVDQYGKTYHKVYTGNRVENQPNYDITIIPKAESSVINHIYMTMWMGDDESTLSHANKDSFYNVTYDIEKNYLTVESPIDQKKKGLVDNENIIYQRARKCLNLDLGNGREVKIKGEFRIWDLTIEEVALLHMILLDPVMNIFLYIDESSKLYAFKKKLEIQYKTVFSGNKDNSSVSVIITEGKTEVPITENITDSITSKIEETKKPEGTIYVDVNILQAESRKVLLDFIPIFCLLMKYYNQNKSAILDSYKTAFPNIDTMLETIKGVKNVETESKVAVPNIKKTGLKKGANIKTLREIAPDIFLKGYARKCQKYQPKIINDEQIEEWKNKKVNGEERQIMRFPNIKGLKDYNPGKPSYNLVCASDVAPYPTLRVNEMENKNEYKFIPCCAYSDQLTKANKTIYATYVTGGDLDKFLKPGAKAEKKITTRKFLVSDKTGSVPKAVEDTVKRYNPLYSDIVRYGVPQSPNSLIHCVCLALDVPSYIHADTEEDKEKYVTSVRKNLFTKINLACMLQELYDYTNEEIENAILDVESFFDPILFYRALEEYYRINIYVFSPTLPSGDDAELGTIVVPRHKIFHSRSLKLTRPTILIMRNIGSESDVLPYPQCELIADVNEEKRTICKIFGPVMTETCHTILQNSSESITFSLDESYSQFYARSNIYNRLDHVSLFSSKIVSQYIDSFGKMRALTIDRNGKLLSIATLPSQPINIESNNIFYRQDHDYVISIFGEPSSVTKNFEGLYDGLWFEALDITNAEYIPIIPTNNPKLNSYQLGPICSVPFNNNNVPNFTNRLTKIKRMFNIIIQLVRWCYDLNDKNDDVDIFANKYFVHPKEKYNGDSVSFYDFSRLKRKLPNAKSTLEAIQKMSHIVPSMFKNNKIIMYNNVFKYRMTKMLKDYSTNNYQTNKYYIDSYFSTEKDFDLVTNGKLFIGDDDLLTWLSINKNSNNFNIKQTIEQKMSTVPEPYIHQDDDGHIYIIQNVLNSSLSKAIAVSEKWQKYQINIGFQPIPKPIDEFPVYMIYGISPYGTMVPIEDFTMGAKNYAKVLYYGSKAEKIKGKNNRYAAVLQLL